MRKSTGWAEAPSAPKRPSDFASGKAPRYPREPQPVWPFGRGEIFTAPAGIQTPDNPARGPVSTPTLSRLLPSQSPLLYSPYELHLIFLICYTSVCISYVTKQVRAWSKANVINLPRTAAQYHHTHCVRQYNRAPTTTTRHLLGIERWEQQEVIQWFAHVFRQRTVQTQLLKESLTCYERNLQEGRRHERSDRQEKF